MCVCVFCVCVCVCLCVFVCVLCVCRPPTVPYPQCSGDPGQEAGHPRVHTGLLGRCTAGPPAHDPQQAVAAGLGQAVWGHERPATVPLRQRGIYMHSIRVSTPIFNTIYAVENTQEGLTITMSGSYIISTFRGGGGEVSHLVCNFDFFYCFITAVRNAASSAIFCRTEAMTNRRVSCVCIPRPPTHLAGVCAPLLEASAEHTGGDLVVVVVGRVAGGVTDDWHVGLLQDIGLMTCQSENQRGKTSWIMTLFKGDISYRRV